MKSIKGTDIQLESDTGDLALIDGDLALIEGVDSIGQHLKQRLRLFLGEWFLQINTGLPYFQNIFGKNPNFVLVEALFRDTILSTPGVTELTDLRFDYTNNDRQLALEFAVTTINGDLNFSDIIEAG